MVNISPNSYLGSSFGPALAGGQASVLGLLSHKTKGVWLLASFRINILICITWSYFLVKNRKTI